MADFSSVDLRADGHVHTRLCNHASGEMEEYVLSALASNLSRITFLEHMEVDIRYDHRTWLRNEDFEVYFDQGKKLAEKYSDQIIIKLGLEVGINLQAIDKIKARLKEYPWDTIGMSYHFYPHNGRHYNMVSRRHENVTTLAEIGIDSVIHNYFTGLTHAIQVLPCSVVCHLDAVLRHYPNRRFSRNHWQKIDTLLQIMKDKATALEINTSGFAIRNEPYPCKQIVQRAIGLDIPLVTGSDAHRPEHVGRFFDQLPAWLQQ